MEYDKLKDSLLSEVDTGLKVAQSLDSKAEFEIYLLYRNKSHVDIKQGLVESTDGTIAGNYPGPGTLPSPVGW